MFPGKQGNRIRGIRSLRISTKLGIMLSCVTQYYEPDEESYDVGDAERIVFDARFAFVGIGEGSERDADGKTAYDGSESKP